MQEASNYSLRSRARRLQDIGGGAQGPPCRVSCPWNLSEYIPLAIYLNGFGLVVSWTRLRKGRLTRGCHLRLARGPFGGWKSSVTLRLHSGVKKRSVCPRNCYAHKLGAGRFPYGDRRSHDLETRHAPPTWVPRSDPRV